MFECSLYYVNCKVKQKIVKKYLPKNSKFSIQYIRHKAEALCGSTRIAYRVRTKIQLGRIFMKPSGFITSSAGNLRPVGGRGFPTPSACSNPRKNQKIFLKAPKDAPKNICGSTRIRTSVNGFGDRYSTTEL